MWPAITRNYTVTYDFGPAPTVGHIARQLNRPVYRVEYVIRSRGIKAAFRAGNARVFTGEDAALIARELHRIEFQRSEGGIK